MTASAPSGPIRVLHVCTIALTAQVFIEPLARYLTDRGYQVAIACSPGEAADGPVGDGAELQHGVAFFPVQVARRISPLADLRSVWHLCRLIRRWRPHIVHSQTAKAGVVGRVAAWLCGTPIVIHTAHAFPFHQLLPPLVRTGYVLVERWAARLADLIMVDTESVRQDGLRNHVVQEQERIVTVPMGLDLKKFSPSAERPATLRQALGLQPGDRIVGTVARLVPDKGIERFLAMAASLSAARDDVRFLVIGDGPLRDSLEHLATTLEIRARVVFTGHRADVAELMRLMDVFALPTLREGFGVVFAEAMAVGVPAVGSRIGPLSEVVEHGVTGYLADPNATEEFASYVLDLLLDEQKRRRFAEAGRRRVEKLFSQERMCEAIERHYRRLLREKGLAA